MHQHTVRRIPTVVEPDGKWEKEPWLGMRPLTVDRFMGSRPDHLPRVAAKLGYDDSHVYVIFRVEDRYVRAVAEKHQDAVCSDSCVEFFFAPGPDIETGYFNLEMNCGGVMLFHYQRVPRKDQAPLPPERLSEIAVAHSLPVRVDPEIMEPTVWTVEYRMPLEILDAYRCVTRPAPGVEWRANFFKCADLTSHPHWLTWAPVNRPRPDFHVPEDFGVLRFA